MPAKKENIPTIEAEIIKGLIKRLKEIPELNKAITSVLLASFEVNQITAKNKKIGNNRFAKYQVKS